MQKESVWLQTQDTSSHAGSAFTLGVGGEVYKTNPFVAKNVLLKFCIRGWACVFTLFGGFPAHSANKQKVHQRGQNHWWNTDISSETLEVWLGYTGWLSSDPVYIHLMEVKKKMSLVLLSGLVIPHLEMLWDHPTAQLCNLDLLKYFLG